MDEKMLRALLERYKQGTASLDEAMEALRRLPFQDMGYAKIDTHRALRQGFAEVIYGAGKTAEEITGIFQRLLEETSGNVMATRVDEAKAQVVCKQIPHLEYDSKAHLLYKKREANKDTPLILVVTAGTSDIPVAREAVLTAELMGNRVESLYDVGVAGIHRLLAARDRIEAANVLIVVAGMEGALASVIGGLTRRPVIAVPTSVGYGAAFGGVAALLSMLNSCATGVAVVNIDNGFGAGAIASRMNQIQAQTERES